MSAFMVNDGTIDRAVSAIIEFVKGAPPEFQLPLPVMRDEHFTETGSVIGRELIKLNMEALRQRYGDKPLPFTYAHREHDSDPDVPLARYWALCCLRYQCAEGNMPDQPLYKLLVAVIEDLAHQCVRAHNTIAGKVDDLCGGLPWDFDD